MNISKQLKMGAVLSYFSIALNIVAGLLYTPWMVNQIGKSEYGIYTLANSIITLFMLDFGLSAATTRFVAKYRTEGDEEGLNKFMNTLYRLYLLIDTVFFCILLAFFFLIDGFYQNLTPTELEKFKVVYIISGLYAVVHLPCVSFNGILTAYEKFIPLKMADVIYRLTLVLFTVIALLCGMGLYALVSVHAICGLISILVKYIYTRKCFKVKVHKGIGDKKSYKEIFGFSLWTTISYVAQRLVFNATPTIIALVVVAASSAIAVFGIVTTIEGYFYTITTAINGLFLARITRITNSENNSAEDLTRLTVSVGRFQFALNGLLLIGFALAGQDFINLWMGPDYNLAYYGILLVVFPGVFFNSLQIANTTLIVKNQVKPQAFIGVTTGVSNVILSLVFSRIWGVVGAALSICIAYIIRLFLTLVLIRKKTEIDLKCYFKQCYLKMAVPIVLTFPMYFVLRLFDWSTWLYFIVKVLIIGSVYGIMLFIFGLKKSEKMAIKMKLSKK